MQLYCLLLQGVVLNLVPLLDNTTPIDTVQSKPHHCIFLYLNPPSPSIARTLPTARERLHPTSSLVRNIPPHAAL